MRLVVSNMVTLNWQKVAAKISKKTSNEAERKTHPASSPAVSDARSNSKSSVGSQTEHFQPSTRSNGSKGSSSSYFLALKEKLLPDSFRKDHFILKDKWIPGGKRRVPKLKPARQNRLWAKRMAMKAGDRRGSIESDASTSTPSIANIESLSRFERCNTPQSLNDSTPPSSPREISLQLFNKTAKPDQPSPPHNFNTPPDEPGAPRIKKSASSNFERDAEVHFEAVDSCLEQLFTTSDPRLDFLIEEWLPSPTTYVPSEVVPSERESAHFLVPYREISL